MRAEMWDKMQYLFRNYYNRMMHAVFYYDKEIDAERLKEAIKYLVDRIPVLHSTFIAGKIRPHWKVCDYSVDDILTVSEKDDDEEREKFLCATLSEKRNVQIAILLSKYREGSSVIAVVNHMCMDGGDLKNFLEILFKLYGTDDKDGIFIKSGTRSYAGVYTGFDKKDAKRAKRLFKNISAVKDGHNFPFTEPSDEDITRIVRRKIDADRIKKFIAYGKSKGATVNDMVLTAYIRSLYGIGNYPEEEAVTVPCMVDLRRHIKDIDETGFCNHTGFMQCTVPQKGKTFDETLAYVVEAMNVNKKDKYLGLYGLPLLNLAYKIFPQCLAEFLIKKFYENPLLGMSNVGLLKKETFRVGDAEMIDGFMTGAIKYKPYMQLAMTTFNGEMTLTVQERCNEEDVKIINRFFDLMESEIDSLSANTASL